MRHYGNDPVAFLTVVMLVDKLGNARVQRSGFAFGNTHTQPYNNTYFDSIGNVLLPLLESTRWQPARVKGTAVPARMTLIVSLQ